MFNAQLEAMRRLASQTMKRCAINSEIACIRVDVEAAGAVVDESSTQKQGVDGGSVGLDVGVNGGSVGPVAAA